MLNYTSNGPGWFRPSKQDTEKNQGREKEREEKKEKEEGGRKGRGTAFGGHRRAGEATIAKMVGLVPIQQDREGQREREREGRKMRGREPSAAVGSPVKAVVLCSIKM